MKWTVCGGRIDRGWRVFEGKPTARHRTCRIEFERQVAQVFLGGRTVTILDSADALQDLAGLPSNRLEALRGARAGQHSIRINAQWRFCFRWAIDGPYDVEIVDYH